MDDNLWIIQWDALIDAEGELTEEALEADSEAEEVEAEEATEE